MDLEELRAFLSVVEAGSFLAAADESSMSRTTLRRRVGALEVRVGVPLLESTQHGVTLTEAGRMLAKRARGLLEETSAILASVRAAGQVPSGLVRASLPVGLPPHLLVSLFGALRGAFPHLRIESRFSEDPLGESLVDVDFAVHFDEADPAGKWISQELMPTPERLIATRDYLARRGTPATIADLAHHDLLTWRAPGDTGRQWPARDGSLFPVQPLLVTSDVHAVRQCSLAGLGIALVPDAMLPDPGVPEDALVVVLPGLVGRDRAVHVSVPEALAETPKSKVVLASARAFLGDF